MHYICGHIEGSSWKVWKFSRFVSPASSSCTPEGKGAARKEPALSPLQPLRPRGVHGEEMEEGMGEGGGNMIRYNLTYLNLTYVHGQGKGEGDGSTIPYFLNYFNLS